MKAQILKIAGVKTDKEFYKLFPSEEAFMKIHGKEFKKAQMGAAVNSGSSGFKPISYQDQFDDVDKMMTGSTEAERQEIALKQQQATASQGGGGGGGFDISGLMKLAGGAMGGGEGMDMHGVTDDSLSTSMAVAARYGRNIPRAQGGIMQGPNNAPSKDYYQNNNPYFATNPGATGLNNPAIATPQPQDNTFSKIGGALGKYAGPVGDIVSGIGELKKEKEARKGAEQARDVSAISLKAAESVDVDARRQQSENMAKQRNAMMQPTTGEELFPVNGVGTNVLAKNGRRLKGGGEIQNTFAPNDIYTDSGYEPLDDSNIKQYYHGGRLHRMQDGGGTPWGMISDKATGFGQELMGGQNGGGKIGKAAGSTIGNIILPGVGGAIGGFVGGIAGNALDTNVKRMKKAQEATQRNMQGMANANMAKGIQAQNQSYMEDGGWVSHDWQPQVIASFGGLDEQEVYDYAHEGMDSLRAGGHLREYTPPSDRAMETAAFGGQLSLDGPGEIEVMGYNPITAATGASGEIAISRGPSHDTQDKGGDDDKTIADYAGNRVNIEGGETVVEKKDGGSVDGSSALNILGDMKIGSQGKVITSDINKQTVSKILKGRDIKDFKFKHVGNNIAKMTKKLNQAEDTYIKLTESDDPLKLSTAKAMEAGVTMQYKDLDKFQTSLIDLQNSYHDTAKEYGYDDTPKFLEDIKKNKVKQQAATGGKFTKAQMGWYSNNPVAGSPEYGQNSKDWDLEDLSEVVIQRKKKSKYPQGIIEPDDEVDNYVRKIDSDVTSTKETSTKSGKKSDWWEKASLFANAALPYFRPSDAEDLDASQLYPEMFAMATNQVTPVQAQTFQPDLATPYDVSFQDQLNNNQADYRAAQRMMGYNPAAQANLNAQKYQANQSVLANQFRANQEMKDKVYGENRNMLNQTKLQNLGIFDRQYERQAGALANTKATTQAVLNSRSDKYAKNKLENRTLQTYENMYNYRFGDNFRAQNMNPLAQFDTQYKGASAEELEAMTALKKAQDKKEAAAAKKDKAVSRNGSIVKSYKNI